MPKLTKAQLDKALKALGREGDSVYHATRKGRTVSIQFVGDREETTLTMPKAKRAKRTTTAPVESDPDPVVVVIGAAPPAREPVTTEPKK